MVALREETGVQRSLTEKLVKSRLQRIGHVERMADERLPKRAAELREQGRRRRGKPRLRDVRKAGEEEDWKKKGLFSKEVLTIDKSNAIAKSVNR